MSKNKFLIRALKKKLMNTIKRTNGIGNLFFEFSVCKDVS